jgi:hypothetical protein
MLDGHPNWPLRLDVIHSHIALAACRLPIRCRLRDGPRKTSVHRTVATSRPPGFCYYASVCYCARSLHLSLAVATLRCPSRGSRRLFNKREYDDPWEMVGCPAYLGDRTFEGRVGAGFFF